MPRNTDTEIPRLLLEWYRTNKRDLPWRRTKDPYRIWVAEIMLQQTRVDTVIPYYERFLKKFPDVRVPRPGPRGQRPQGLGEPRLLFPRPPPP